MRHIDLTISAEPSSSLDDSTPNSSASSVSPAKQQVVVIDADVEICHAIHTLLSGLDIEVRTFSSASEFTQAGIHHSNIVCFFIEVDLPDVNGVDLLERFNRTGTTAPTIIMATCSDVATAVRAMRAKAIDFIEKPLVANLLLKRVKMLLERHIAEQV